MSKIQIVRQSPRMKRAMRTPQHTFNLRNQPWQLQPFMCHPVLPGETLTKLDLMSRVVTDPVKDKLMGWWCEYFVFYVKHRDLAARDTLVNMHLQQGYDISALNSAADAKYYHNTATTPNWTKLCMTEILKWYFRDADEAEPTAIDTLPVSKINLDGWWQSLRKGAATNPAAGALDGALPGDAPTLPTEGLPAGYSTQYAQWEAMVAAGVTNATFEDYLRSWGVKVDPEVDEEIYRPELIRYRREFTYPTNTVEPTTGTPSSAAVWSFAMSADKDRYFKEPGFLVGVQLVRPKVLLANLGGQLVDYMTTAFDWLPATLLDESFMSLKSFNATSAPAGPVTAALADNYWVDLKDLFIYGDQFVNHTDQKATVALPTTAGNLKYPVEADAAALFVDTATPKKYIRTDGICTLHLKSSVHGDTTR